MRKMLAAWFLPVYLLFLPLNLFSQTNSLDWQLQFLREKNNVSMEINRTIRMETGESFKLILKADEACYCYVIVYDSDQEFYIWYNQPLKKDTGTHLFPLHLVEPSGVETIYVIISNSRQPELERLINLFGINPSRQNTTNLYSEIIRLQNSASALGEPAAVIIPSGGSTRGLDSAEEFEGEKGFATKFTGRNLYVRAIGVRH